MNTPTRPQILGITLQHKLTYNTHIVNICSDKCIQIIRGLNATSWGNKWRRLQLHIERTTLEYTLSIRHLLHPPQTLTNFKLYTKRSIENYDMIHAGYEHTTPTRRKKNAITPNYLKSLQPSTPSTSTSNTNNVEIIHAQLNKLTVTSVCKPPNEQFSFGSNPASTQMNVVIGDFNSHGVEWGYKSTDENGRLAEQWSETNQLSLVHDAKQPKSFNSKRWQQGYNPDLAFVSYNIAHLAEKDVMDAIPKTQHRPISIKLNAAIRSRNVPFRRRYNLKKAKW